MPEQRGWVGRKISPAKDFGETCARVKEPFSGLSLCSIHPCSLVIHAKHSSLRSDHPPISHKLAKKKRKSNEERALKERKEGGDSWTMRIAGPSTLLFRNRKLVCRAWQNPILEIERVSANWWPTMTRAWKSWRPQYARGYVMEISSSSDTFPPHPSPFRVLSCSLFLSLSFPSPLSFPLYRLVLLHRYS